MLSLMDSWSLEMETAGSLLEFTARRIDYAITDLKSLLHKLSRTEYPSNLPYSYIYPC